MIRHLWEVARRLPADRTFADPVTGHRIMVERFRGYLTLTVGEPAHPEDPDADREATLTRYMLGFGWRPIPPPLFRHVTPIHDTFTPKLSWRQARQALRLAEQTGAANSTHAELMELRTQLDRAIAAADDDPY